MAYQVKLQNIFKNQVINALRLRDDNTPDKDEVVESLEEIITLVDLEPAFLAELLFVAYQDGKKQGKETLKQQIANLS